MKQLTKSSTKLESRSFNYNQEASTFVNSLYGRSLSSTVVNTGVETPVKEEMDPKVFARYLSQSVTAIPREITDQRYNQAVSKMIHRQSV